MADTTPQLLRDYPERVFLGNHPDFGDMYLIRPEWECNWYWSFGYLRPVSDNVRDWFHTHLDSVLNDTGKMWYDALNHVFGKSLAIPTVPDEFDMPLNSDWRLWLFLEMTKSIYFHKEMAEVLNRGGMHLSNNPHAGLLKDPERVHKINHEIIPALIDTFYVALGVVDPLPGIDYGYGWKKEIERREMAIKNMENI
ncbi:hypothetical protein [Aggregatibacter kilianii]|uniref:hypothetical protein n=1 Tax=Aggregatibacter kilianii TaxID=2025884 RepID=UPI000D655CEF|nr:hypothetical protein [Aggregatibacter kilianii]